MARACVLLAILASQPVLASAQSFWLREPGGRTVSVEWRKPAFDADDNPTLLTSALFLSARLPLSARLRLVTEVPLAHLGFNTSLVNTSNTAFGNPLLGLAFGAPGAHGEILVGLRLPLASSEDEAVFVGRFAAPDRLGAFHPETFSLFGLGTVHYRHPSGLVVRFRAGPSLLVSTTREVGERPETYLRYGVQAWYAAGRVQVGGGLTGQAWLTEMNLTLQERTTHHLTLAVAGTPARWQPGFLVSVPLDDDIRAVVRAVLGLTLTLSL